jgi:hypothetical protein
MHLQLADFVAVGLVVVVQELLGAYNALGYVDVEIST